jgi:hypothetical protein
VTEGSREGRGCDFRSRHIGERCQQALKVPTRTESRNEPQRLPTQHCAASTTESIFGGYQERKSHSLAHGTWPQRAGSIAANSSLLAAGVPLDPRARCDAVRCGAVREWTTPDVATLRELHGAVGDLLSARRSWDAIRPRRR